MRPSLRVPVVLALVAAMAGAPAAPAGAALERAVVLLSPQYICWESQPAQWSTAAVPAVPAEQGCELRIELSGPTQEEVLLTYRTEPGSARPELDYVDVREGRVAIPPGESAGYISVLILPDREREQDEAFVLRLLHVRGADVDRREAIVTIRDFVQSGG